MSSILAPRPDDRPPQREDWGTGVTISVAAHLALIAALYWGMHWHSSSEPAEASAELWAAMPETQAPPPVVAPPPPRFTPKLAQPKGRPGDWVTTNDYPSRALREEREGTTGFRLSVGPDGRVTNCEITSSSGSPDLDAATCDNLRRRARFTPATDGEGQPTSGSYSSRTRWVIPKD